MLGGEADVSASLEYANAACILAQTIYYARLQAFGLDGVLWPDLDPNEKAKYVTRATEVLESLRPATTSEYFDLAASLARAQFAVVPRD